MAFLVELITSNLRHFLVFVFISAVFTSASFVIFRLLNNTTAEVRRNSKELQVLHGPVLIIQLFLIAELMALLVQIIFFTEYYTAFIITMAALSPLTAHFVMIMLARHLLTGSDSIEDLCSPHFRIGIFYQRLCLHLHFFR